MKLSIYQAVLKTYAEQRGITLEQALDAALEQSKGKPDAKRQIEKYKRAYEGLKYREGNGGIADETKSSS